MTRPNLAYSINKLIQCLYAPTMAHWNACKRVLRHVKGTIDYGLAFRPAKVLNLEGFSNADWASNLNDKVYEWHLWIFRRKSYHLEFNETKSSGSFQYKVRILSFSYYYH